MRDFAKIVTASNGQQVVGMVRCDGDGVRFVMTAAFDGAMVDMTIEFNDGHEEKAFAALEAFSTATADGVIRQAAEFGMPEGKCGS